VTKALWFPLATSILVGLSIVSIFVFLALGTKWIWSSYMRGVAMLTEKKKIFYDVRRLHTEVSELHEQQEALKSEIERIEREIQTRFSAIDVLENRFAELTDGNEAVYATN